MTTVVYITHDGTRHEVDVADGTSLMKGAVNNGVPGIDADCGGQCACATCHVLVDEAWYGKLDAGSSIEKDMLEMMDAVSPNSRLACQIVISPTLDGLVVGIPETQG